MTKPFSRAEWSKVGELEFERKTHRSMVEGLMKWGAVEAKLAELG